MKEEKIKMTLIQGDCLKVLPTIPDESVDLVLTDPPYGITKEKWDKVPSKECFAEIFRVSKNQIIFGGNYFDLPKTNAWIIWYKKPFLKNSNEAEMIWTSFKMKTKVLEYRYAGNVEGGNKPNYKKEKVVYTSEKPVKVLEWILENFSKENDTILDPFLGSGTTMVACRNLKRSCIGIEIEPKYIEITKKRLNWGSSLFDKIEWEFRVVE
jgi:DNA modification methylase